MNNEYYDATLPAAETTEEKKPAMNAKHAKAHSIETMTPLEKRASSSLALIYATRMIGLFMIMPVFALYAQNLEGVTPELIGIAIGIYGLSQAILGIPFGMASDRIGRKPVIAFGLIIFAIGSVIAAMGTDIYTVIAGRAIQGAGAIAAVVMALAADLTREEHRLKAMAMIGASIGLSFSLAMIAGPMMSHWIGVDGIFWFTAGLALVAILVLYLFVPNPAVSRFHRDTQAMPSQFKNVIGNGELLRLDAGIFVLHMVLTSMFVAMPSLLRDQAGLAPENHTWLYLPVMLIGLVVMVPFIIIAEKRRRMKQIFSGAIFILALAQVLVSAGANDLVTVFLAMSLFFIGFNVLEASLPSLVSKTAPPDIKGTAMGVYSTAQFLGAFVGGVSGGMLLGKYGASGVFLFNALMLVFWLILAATMKNPRYLSSFLLNVGPMDDERARKTAIEITAVTGVAEAVVIGEEGVAYLKVDNHALDREALQRFVSSAT